MKARVLLTLLLLAAGAGPAAAQGWQDDFDAEALDPRYTWVVPVDGPTFSLKERPGWLRVTLPRRNGGFNHWSEPAADDAPQLRIPLPQGDWEIETRIQLQRVERDGHFHLGLVAGETDTAILTWGPFQGPSLADGAATPEAWLEPTGTSGYARVPGDARDVALRLTKVGKAFRATLRRGEQGEWVEAGAYAFPKPPRFAGLIAKSFATGSGVTFDVDYLRLKLLPPGSVPPIAVGPARPELAELGRRVKGFVVWESNRTGKWELYRISTDGSGFQQLTQLGKDNPLPFDAYLRPQVSPDGKLVLFAYGRRAGPVQAWVVPAEGGEARRVTTGHPLNWSPDGREILFGRDRQVWRHRLADGKESVVHPAQLPEYGRGMVGSVRADLKAVVMRTPRVNEYFVLDQAKTLKTTGGCEARFSTDGRCLYWVQGPKDFRAWDIANNREWQILGQPPSKPHDYTYFPTVSDDGRWLAYGASPSQHDHDTSDYEIFVVELKDWKAAGRPVRLSWDPHTDRWPFLWVEKTGFQAARGG